MQERYAEIGDFFKGVHDMVQPLFYLFKTINSCYLFDSNRNNIYPISPDAYQILFNLKDGDITLEDAQNSSQEISELIKNGLLSVKHVKKIEHVLHTVC